MKNISIAVHGGAGEDSDFIRENQVAYQAGLLLATNAGYKILEKGGSAAEAVETAVKILEDLPLFNAGRGSALNNRGEIEMDASIMEGSKLKAGAVAMVRNVKNPVVLARLILENTHHILISGEGALALAKEKHLALEPDAYFVTTHQYDELIKARNTESMQELMEKRVHGTVGAVALDKKGNVAAATSTGGTTNSLSGRIGDSCLIGAGCYANNQSCAVSGTGDGEFLISGVIAHSVAFYKELKQCTLQEACDYVIHQRNEQTDGDIGVISVDTDGDIGIAFNCDRMHRAWVSNVMPIAVKIYSD